ncbi:MULTISPECIES: YdcH family protein [unclassified Paracoccus (in: a-proteobacteria)]|uniref:YdcH family protein n=1 Tax=unclassified Paracoccus (in: a-proteobacteria) TaxID=2688777 RepID=UPI00160075E4|nr:MULTISPECIES: YdcH family protein [unclassified Paracoccus (in: a-proteobacteria)]MBB1490116.1 YdcH family protein [Paracoccus sp. MC1854]MBB1496704.1 YdcH family protein [Paracoccus sp. MC1862]QQO43713.1 YdcH family protein [Paracoccus sp. MC1862]
MSVQSHVAELRRKHQVLSDEVERAQRAPGTDDLSISTMKKEKLRLKEEIERLTQ